MSRATQKPSRLAIVTGASRGIGAAIAEALSEAGYELALIARNERDLARLAARLSRKKGSAPIHVFPCDVSKRKDLIETASIILRELGTPSVLINNAGWGGPFHSADEVSDAEWDQIFATNLDSMRILTRSVLPLMKKQKYGRIVNISSIQGLFGGVQSSTYSASKHAIIGFTKSIASEWGLFGITCNAVCPGFIETDMLKGSRSNKPSSPYQQLLKRIPVGKFGTPEEVAGLVAYVVGPQGAYINGSAIAVDGGLSASLP